MKWLRDILRPKPRGSDENHVQQTLTKIGKKPFLGSLTNRTDNGKHGKHVHDSNADGYDGPVPKPPMEGTDHNPTVPDPMPATAWLLQLTAGNTPVLFSSLASRLSARTEPVAVLKVPLGTQHAHQGSPVFVASVTLLSSGLKAMLNLSAKEDYKIFMNALSNSEPKFASTLCTAASLAVQACSSDIVLAPEDIQPVRLSVALPTGNLQLAITPFLIKPTPKSSQREAALLIEHSLAGQEHSLHQLLQHRNLLLNNTYTMLTLCNFKGEVMHQNAAAIQYAGNWSEAAQSAGDAPRGTESRSYLEQLLQLEPELLDIMLEEVSTGGANGGQWNAIVRVPPSLNTAGQPVATHTVAYSASCVDSTTAALIDSQEGSLFNKTNLSAHAVDLVVSSNAPSWSSPHLSQPKPGSFTRGVSSAYNHAANEQEMNVESLLDSLVEEPNHASFKACDVRSHLEINAAHDTSQVLRRAHTGNSSSAMDLKPSFLASAPGDIDVPVGPTSEHDVQKGQAKRRGITRQASRLRALMVTGTSVGPVDGASAVSGANPVATMQGLGLCALNIDNALPSSVTTTVLSGQAVHAPSQRPSCCAQTLEAVGASEESKGPAKPAGDTGGATDKQPGVQAGLNVLQGACSQPARAIAQHEVAEEADAVGCWHEITVSPVIDPATGETLLVIEQCDVSDRMESEEQMTQVSNACVQLLELIFPRHVLEYLTVKQGAKALASRMPQADAAHDMDLMGQMATKHACVTLFFCDIVGFTTMSKEVDPVMVMRFLNDLYTQYDHLADKFGVYKVETVGDCYVVAGGLMHHDSDGFSAVNKDGADGPGHALAVYQFAQAVLQVARNTLMPHNNQPTKVRVGLHSGPVTAGVVGHRMPKFCLFGDTMNTASRMETTCKYGCIHMSEATYALLEEADATDGIVSTGGVEVKGKGHMITYLYTPVESASTSSTMASTKLPSPSLSVPLPVQAGFCLPSALLASRRPASTTHITVAPSHVHDRTSFETEQFRVLSRGSSQNSMLSAALDIASFVRARTTTRASRTSQHSNLSRSGTEELLLEKMGQGLASPSHSRPVEPQASEYAAPPAAPAETKAGKPASRFRTYTGGLRGSDEHRALMPQTSVDARRQSSKCDSRDMWSKEFELAHVLGDDSMDSVGLHKAEYTGKHERGHGAHASPAARPRMTSPELLGSVQSSNHSDYEQASRSVHGKGMEGAFESSSSRMMSTGDSISTAPPLMSMANALQRVGTLQRMASVRRGQITYRDSFNGSTRSNTQVPASPADASMCSASYFGSFDGVQGKPSMDGRAASNGAMKLRKISSVIDRKMSRRGSSSLRPSVDMTYAKQPEINTINSCQDASTEPTPCWISLHCTQKQH